MNRVDVNVEYISLLDILCRSYPSFLFSHIPSVKVSSIYEYDSSR